MLAESERQTKGREAAKVSSMRSRLEAAGTCTETLGDEEVATKFAELARKMRRESDEAEARKLAGTLYEAANCPKRHTLNLSKLALAPDDNPDWHNTRNLLTERGGDGFLVALLGKRGTGKTQLAASVILDACQQGRSCRYVKRLDLGRLIRRTFGAPSTTRGKTVPSEADVVDELVAYDLLVIDEVHQVGDSDFDRTLLTNLLDRRYDEMKDTILISNEDRSAFAETVGSSVVSRLHEAGEAIVCDWPSYRMPGSWRQTDEEAASGESCSEPHGA